MPPLHFIESRASPNPGGPKQAQVKVSANDPGKGYLNGICVWVTVLFVGLVQQDSAVTGEPHVTLLRLMMSYEQALNWCRCHFGWLKWGLFAKPSDQVKSSLSSPLRKHHFSYLNMLKMGSCFWSLLRMERNNEKYGKETPNPQAPRPWDFVKRKTKYK